MIEVDTYDFCRVWYGLDCIQVGYAYRLFVSNIGVGWLTVGRAFESWI